MRKLGALVVVVITGCLASPLVMAADPFGVYIGGAVGQSTVRVDGAVFTTSGGAPANGPISFSGYGTGWKLLVGLRPISWAGAELEYVDFGSTSLSFASGAGMFEAFQASNRPKAWSAFGVLYAPIPVPFIDVYGKAGLALFNTNASGTLVCLTNCPSGLVLGTLHRSGTDTHFAYGAGAQLKAGHFAIRIEYERISAGTGDPSLLSAGLTWTFK